MAKAYPLPATLVHAVAAARVSLGAWYSFLVSGGAAPASPTPQSQSWTSGAETCSPLRAQALVTIAG